MTLNELAPQGHYEIWARYDKKSVKHWRVKLFAENGEKLSTSDQPFDRRDIAHENVRQQMLANKYNQES
jgi:hypothetical protein